jgi:DNA polymerase epsilon subunit 2
LWLDHPKTLPNLRRMFEVYAESTFRPLAFVFCGNFSQKSCTVGGAAGLAKYTGARAPLQVGCCLSSSDGC